MSAGTSSPPPTLQPICFKKYPSCELGSFCASHVAALAVLIFSLLVFVVNVVRAESHILAVQTSLLMLALILWYFFGALDIEEKYVVELKRMRGHCPWLELFVRVALFIALEAVEVASNKLRPAYVTETVFTLGLLYVVTLGFMSWDVIVDAGGETAIAWKFFKSDSALSGAVLACLLAAIFDNQAASEICLFVSGITVGIVVWHHRETVSGIFSRLISRSTLR